MRNKKAQFKTVDILIVVFCFVGTCVSGAAFWREYTNTLVKLNEEPVGSIIFQKRVAQRKFVDRNVWDRLKEASLVYNGDTIRTIEQSEAIVIFQDQVTHLSMGESTMIQILYDTQSGARIDFAGGNLEVVSENQSIVITSGTSTIVVEGQAVMEKNEEGFVLAVSDGTASFDGMEMDAGNVIALDSNGKRNTNPIIVMTSFSASMYVLGKQGEAVPVDFSWKNFFFTPDTAVVVEIAADRSFNRIVESREVAAIYGAAAPSGVDAASVAIPLEPGKYWWRAFPCNAGSRKPANRFYPSGTLEVIPAAATVLLSPLQAAELVFPAETLVALSWSAVEGASAYLMEIAAEADMSAPLVSRRIVKNVVTQTGLDFGRWFWRITPVFPPHIRGSAIPSATGEFFVIRGKPILATPVLTFPLQNGKVLIDAAGASKRRESTSRLMWNHDPNADSWLVEIADNAAMLNPALKQNTASHFFPIASSLLQDGKTWYWRVTALGGEHPAVSAVRKFEVGYDNPPPAKPALSAIPKPEPETEPEPEPESNREQHIPRLPSIIFSADNDHWLTIDAETAAANDRVLLLIIQFLESNREYRLRIEGHANPVVNPADIIGRRREYVEELQPMSEIRAKAVMDLLVNLGADPDRLSYQGYGGERPLAAWEDVNNWWRNRRADFVLSR
ncbi:MAG: OmpA family protein [Treponema sp.]|nr:OmpA family protein [Treponema sp.]